MKKAYCMYVQYSILKMFELIVLCILKLPVSM